MVELAMCGESRVLQFDFGARQTGPHEAEVSSALDR